MLLNQTLQVLAQVGIVTGEIYLRLLVIVVSIGVGILS